MATTLSMVNYLVSVEQLSNRNVPTQDANTTQVLQSPFFGFLAPYVIYAPVALFTLLFACAFGLQLISKVRQAKNILAIFFISLMAAGIPSVLTYVQNGGGQEAKAGPQEAPKVVRVSQSGVDSVKITWNTGAVTIGAIRLSLAPYVLAKASVYIADNGSMTQDHSVIIPHLSQGKEYEFEVLSKGEWYDDNGKYIKFTFLK